MLNIILKTIAILFLLATGCTSKDEHSESITGYTFDHPDISITLPDTLHEISGLTVIDSNTVACVQDENGIVFFYDLQNQVIRNQFSFGPDGDYEEITNVGQTLFVLRSDGTLFEIINFGSKDAKADSIATGIKAKNNEGLCYDHDNHRLLIASKGKIGKGREFKNARAIYSFDLQSRVLAEKVLHQIDLPTIKQFALDNNISLPAIPQDKKKKKSKNNDEPNIKFNTSAISIHPITKQLFVLSADDKLIFIFSPEGHLEHIESLKPALFNKAEGITFFENGDMVITNEGEDNKPTLLRFSYKK